MNRKKALTGRKFDALAPGEKQKIVEELESGTPEQRRAASKALTAAQQAKMDRIVRKMGRPKLGTGTQVVSVTVEKELLKRADAYANSVGLKRSELFTLGLKRVLPNDGR